MKNNDVRLRIEELEAKTLLSGSAVGPAGIVAALKPTPLPLSGTIRGGFTESFLNPDAGIHFNLNGSGNLALLGAVQAGGAVDSIGFIEFGHATGTLVLKNTQGSVTLGISGPKGVSGLPPRFYYHIVDGTGAYKNLHENGYFDVQLRWTSVPPPLPFSQDVISVRFQGNFSMTIHPYA